jgi:hypothetical protein
MGYMILCFQSQVNIKENAYLCTFKKIPVICYDHF